MSKSKARRPQVIIDLEEYERLKAAAQRSQWNLQQTGASQITIYPAAGRSADDYLVVLKADYNRRKVDADLGALVRRMHKGQRLVHDLTEPYRWATAVGPTGVTDWFDTPEAALKAALGEE